MNAHLAAFDRTLEKSYEWVADVMQELEEPDPKTAFRALRAVLHALRDRLPATEAVELAAEMPMLIRGLYFEGWRMAGKPVKARTREAFLAMVLENLGPLGTPQSPGRVAQAVLRVMSRHISGGEISDVIQSMPEDLRRLWMSV
jgi:uncharacterized protein (DUF2267 family)